MIRIGLILLILTSIYCFLEGGWNYPITCSPPIYHKSPFELLERYDKELKTELGSHYLKNLKVVFLKVQLVAGQNYVAIFEFKTETEVKFVGIKAFIHLGSIGLEYSRVISDDVIAVLNYVGEKQKTVLLDLNC